MTWYLCKNDDEFIKFHQSVKSNIEIYLLFSAKVIDRYSLHKVNSKKSFDKAIELAIEKNKCMIRYKCKPNTKSEICSLN